MSDMIGKEIIGFRFSDKKYPAIGYPKEMDECVGKTGVIKRIHKDVGSVFVYFEDVEDGWNYPLSLVKSRLRKSEYQKPEVTKSVSKEIKPYVYAIVDTSENRTVKVVFNREHARSSLSDYKEIHKNFKIAKLSFDKFIR